MNDEVVLAEIKEKNKVNNLIDSFVVCLFKISINSDFRKNPLPTRFFLAISFTLTDDH